MKLNLEQIKSITTGAVRISEEENGINFYRFTKEQEELYKKRSNTSYMRSLCTSGITFNFKTNSEILYLKVEASEASSRSYFSFDIFINGKMHDSINNFSHLDMTGNYSKLVCPYGKFKKEIHLGKSEKEICIYFPYTVKAVVKELSLSDSATITPIKASKKLLAIGDSITHGYDALNPSNKYVTKLVRFLNAEEINKGIGGERFLPEFALLRDDFTPDYITVAYGTNDWNSCERDELISNCEEFYKNLSATYPDSKIFAISPVWRKDYMEDRKSGAFRDVERIIEKVTESLKNVAFINGFDLVPHEENCFGDLRLHPNDKGFEYYFKNLIEKLNFN